MRSLKYRNSKEFLRTCDTTIGFMNIPVVKKQDVEIPQDFICFDKIKNNDIKKNIAKCVHHFGCKSKLLKPNANISRYNNRIKQYSLILTPEVRIEDDTAFWQIISETAQSRWCGAEWQSIGCKVITTVSWGDQSTYEICFSGIETNSPIAISTNNCKNKDKFLNGYNALFELIQPPFVICYGEPLSEMQGKIISIQVCKEMEVK